MISIEFSNRSSEVRRIFIVCLSLFLIFSSFSATAQIVASEDIGALEKSFIEQRYVMMIEDTLESDMRFKLEGNLYDFSKDTMDYSFCTYYQVRLRINDLKKIEKFRKQNAPVAAADSTEEPKSKGKFKKMLKAAGDAMATVAVVAVAVALDADLDGGTSSSETSSSNEQEAISGYIPSADKITTKIAEGDFTIDSLQWELFEHEYIPVFNKSFVQRKAMRVTFSRTGQELKGALLFPTSDEQKAIFIPDVAVSESARIANQQDHAAKLRLAAESEIHSMLDGLKRHRDHLFGPSLYIHAVGFQEIFDPAYYPTEEFSYPHMRYAFLLSNKNVSGMNPTDLNSVAQRIQFVDSINFVEFMLDGYRLNGYDFLSSAISGRGKLTGENATATQEFNRVYEKYKNKMDLETWNMIPESEWRTAAEALKSACSGLRLDPLKMVFDEHDHPYDRAQPELLLGNSSWNYGYDISFVDSTRYTINRSEIDVTFDERPLLEFWYSGSSPSSGMSHSTKPSRLNTDYPVSFDLEGLWPYITVKGNVFVAQAVADAEYEAEQERARKEEEQNRKKKEAQLQEIADRYGQKYVDAYNNLNIISGMPKVLAEDLISRFYIVKNVSEYSNTKTYQCQSIFDRYSGIWVTFKGSRVSSVSTY